MRSDHVPETPLFWEELGGRLRLQAVRRRRRLPIPVAALRALRRTSAAAGHVAVATTLAGLFWMVQPVPRQATLPTTPPASTPTAYVAQFGGTMPRPGTVASTARERGFEVEIIRTYVADRSADGKVLDVRHLGTSVERLPAAPTARGPVVIVVGVAVVSGGAVAH